jgi:hypothetical protein
MSKQTAVDYLVDAIRNYIEKGTLNAVTISELKMGAKVIEKEQMLDAYNAGKDDHHHMSYAEQYYNETYGGDK